MTENLIFSLNATLPIFLTMAAGILFRRMGLMDEDFAAKTNAFVFRIALPALLFEDLSCVAFDAVWDVKFVLFCFGITAVCILILTFASFLFVEKASRGEFVQGGYRSSAAILGIALIQNIYGNSGMAPLMIVATVPLYNVAAVFILSLMNPKQGRLDGKALKKSLRGVAANPIIWGILLGVLWSLSGLSMPAVAEKTLHNIAVLATPLGLMSMGASFEGKKALAKLRLTIVCSLIKLIGLAAAGLPLAAALGFRGEKLIAILIMLGSATTVSSYIMAKNMDCEGTLTASVVMMTTLFSAVTLTGWLYLLRSMGLI
ncbi:MAG: AEC family transporter [Lachnospiraceae bacterium]|nr:AEC family transporter [Lachnospiraceae bacterium]